MAGFRTYFTGFDGLWRLTGLHPDNRFIRKEFRGDESSENPLLLLNLREGLFYFLRVRQDGLIAGSAAVSVQPKGKEEGLYPEADILLLEHIGMRREFRKTGHAKALIKAVFEKAATVDAVIALTPLEQPAIERISALPKLHRQFPNVSILYPKAEKPVTGKESYRLIEGDGYGCVTPVFR